MLTIGEFSHLCHATSRMLRHYDAIGLLRPAHLGENGYRYYDEAQLPILFQIEKLKEYGFSLAEIGELLLLSPEALSARIHRKRVEAYGALHQMRETLRRMEEDILRMEGTELLNEKYPIIVMNTPPQRVFGLRRRINVSQTHELFQELYRDMELRGLRRVGATQLIYLGEEFSYEHMDVEAQVEVAGEHPDVRELPARLCVATTHTGPYEALKYAYDAIGSYLAAHAQYRVCGPAIERYIRDEAMVTDANELETGILFPVEMVENKTV